MTATRDKKSWNSEPTERSCHDVNGDEEAINKEAHHAIGRGEVPRAYHEGAISFKAIIVASPVRNPRAGT
jgi:hypothetical protein